MAYWFYTNNLQTRLYCYGAIENPERVQLDERSTD